MTFTTEQETRIQHYQGLIREAWAKTAELPAPQRPQFKLDTIKLANPNEKPLLAEAYVRLIRPR